MDAVIFGIIAVALTVVTLVSPEQATSKTGVENVVPEDTTRTTKLNDSFYEDLNAFSEISTALGFPIK